jgi:hypothetical protein
VHKSGPQAGEVCRNPDGTPNGCTAGNVELRPDKRPRPLVIRSVEGACLTVHFTNWLTDLANPNNEQQGPPGVLINNNQVAGRCAGFHATGTELVNGTEDDGSMTGANNGGGNAGNTNSGQDNCGEGLAAPGQSRIYELYTPHEGAYIINSYGATLGSEANGGNLGLGMFGALNVQPKGARIYRSQVTEEEGSRPADHQLRNVVPQRWPLARRRQGRPADHQHASWGRLRYRGLVQLRTRPQRHQRDHRRTGCRR